MKLEQKLYIIRCFILADLAYKAADDWSYRNSNHDELILSETSELSSVDQFLDYWDFDDYELEIIRQLTQ